MNGDRITKKRPVSELRPMDLGDILDAVFRLYRNNFLTFIGIVALIQIPIILIQILIMMIFDQQITTDMVDLVRILPSFDPEVDSFADLPLSNLATFLGTLMLVGIVEGVIAQQVVNGALANAISRRYHNQPVSILSAYGFGIHRMLWLVLAALIVGILLWFV